MSMQTCLTVNTFRFERKAIVTKWSPRWSSGFSETDSPKGIGIIRWDGTGYEFIVHGSVLRHISQLYSRGAYGNWLGSSQSSSGYIWLLIQQNWGFKTKKIQETNYPALTRLVNTHTLSVSKYVSSKVLWLSVYEYCILKKNGLISVRTSFLIISYPTNVMNFRGDEMLTYTNAWNDSRWKVVERRPASNSPKVKERHCLSVLHETLLTRPHLLPIISSLTAWLGLMHAGGLTFKLCFTSVQTVELVTVWQAWVA